MATTANGMDTASPTIHGVAAKEGVGVGEDDGESVMVDGLVSDGTRSADW